jgi:hypothetical protein
MIPLTPDLRERLLVNSRKRSVGRIPVVKLFNPLGARTWRATDLKDDNTTIFGLADLGSRYPELGDFGLAEMQALRLPLWLGIERDLHFEGAFPRSIFAEAAPQAGHIVFSKHLLLAAAASLQGGS